jgi:L-rhamnonate dehydratase
VEWDQATVSGLDASAYHISEGVVHVPDLPGFGLQIDEDAFARAVEDHGFVVSRG